MLPYLVKDRLVLGASIVFHEGSYPLVQAFPQYGFRRAQSFMQVRRVTQWLPNAGTTSVHYIDLLKWIIRSGYVPLNRLEATLPRLCTYGNVEHELAHEVMGYIAMRRKALVALSQGGEVRIYDPELEVTTIPLSTEEQLAVAYSEIKYLQQQLYLARRPKPISQPNSQMNTKTRHTAAIHTAAIVILALAKLKGANLESRDIVSSIQRWTEDLKLGLSHNTIRDWINDALGMLEIDNSK
jgi:hypothetical protein